MLTRASFRSTFDSSLILVAFVTSWTAGGSLMTKDNVSAEITPASERANQAALALQQLGFRVLHVGPTISVEGARGLWESTFGVAFEDAEHTAIAGVEDSKVVYQRALSEGMSVPSELQELISDIAFQQPPEFY